MIKPMAVAVFIGLLCACANSVNINTDYFEGTDFSHLKTYRWYDDVYPSRTAEYRSYGSADKLVRQATDRELKQRGFHPIAQGDGDFLLNYRVSSEAKMNMNSYYNDPGVHGGVSTGTYGTSVALGVSVGGGPTYYKEGTVVIDIIDFASNSVVWRAVADGRLPKNMGLKERNNIIRELIPRMLKDFPPD